MIEWIRPSDHLPKESGAVLVGALSVDGDKFVSIQNVPYSAKHKAFNVYDWMKIKRARRIQTIGRKCLCRRRRADHGITRS